MSIALKSGERLAMLKQGIEGVTGETYTDLTEAVNGLKDKQFEAGQKAEYDAFWDEYQQNGQTNSYNGAFAGTRWTANTLNPKYDVKPYWAQQMFWSNYMIIDLAEHFARIGKKLDFSGAASMSACFSYSKFTRLGEIDASKSGATDYSLFNEMTNLVTLEKLIVAEHSIFNSWFVNCTSLEKLIVKGTIGKNGFNVQWSAKLTHESLMSIINALQDKSTDTSGTVWTVTLGAANIAKLTAEEQQIAHKKGWLLG